MDEPGQLIIPHGPDDEPKSNGDGAPQPERPEQPTPPAPSPSPSPEPHESAQQANVQTPATPAPVEPASTEPAVEGGWFHPGPASMSATSPDLATANLDWTASEFIAHEKGAEWYFMLAIGAVVITTVVYLLTKDKISTAVLLFAAITFGIFAGHKPRIQAYSLSGRGLQIGQKFYNLQDFKTFSVSIDGAIASIVLNPLKRFMPPLTIYVAPDLEERVVDFLSAYLPFEQHKADAVDSLLKRIRF